jgi:hypothetical protein
VGVLVAAKGEPAGERGDEPVAAGYLGEPVDREHARDRQPGVEVLVQQAALAQLHRQTAEAIAAHRADRDTGRDRIGDVGERPLAEPVRAALRRNEEAEQ